MAKNKKGLSSKVVTVFNPINDEEFELYVTYCWIEDKNYNDYLHHEFDGMINQDDIDIKQYESDNDEDVPDWVTEEMVYDALTEELEEDYYEQDEDDYEEDLDDENDIEDDYNSENDW